MRKTEIDKTKKNWEYSDIKLRLYINTGKGSDVQPHFIYIQTCCLVGNLMQC